VAIEQDVLVIGGGIAGLTAAISAAREGASVRLVSYKETTLRHASGLIDLLGYTPDGEGPLEDPYDALETLPADHPYRLLGEARVREGMATFDEITGDRYRGEHTDANALVPTFGGTVKPTARYPAGAAAGLASDPRSTLFVGIERVPDFEPSIAADRLAAVGVPFDTSAATVEFPIPLRDDAKKTRFAHLLDANETVDGAGEGVRRALAETVKPHLGDAERVGFPAILGQDHPAEVRDDLASALGADVFEVPMGPPNLPGLRLESLLYDALEAAGGRFEVGSPVVSYSADGEVIEQVAIDRSGQEIPMTAEQYVLATGGLESDGIGATREQVTEPLFDCHVPQPADRYDWFEDDVFGDHAFARFGVDVAADLRPQTADGDPEFGNLRAAGGVVGNYDYAAQKCGSGVSIATGHGAGQRAAEDATQ